MTSTFHLYYTVVVNSDLVNRKTFQVEKVNIPNITKNNFSEDNVSDERFKAARRQSMVLRFFNSFSFY